MKKTLKILVLFLVTISYSGLSQDKIDTLIFNKDEQLQLTMFVNKMDSLLMCKYDLHNPYEALKKYIKESDEGSGLICIPELFEISKTLSVFDEFYFIDKNKGMIIQKNKKYYKYLKHISEESVYFKYYYDELSGVNDITPLISHSMWRNIEKLDLTNINYRLLIGFHYLYLCNRYVHSSPSGTQTRN